MDLNVRVPRDILPAVDCTDLLAKEGSGQDARAEMDAIWTRYGVDGVLTSYPPGGPCG